MALRANNVIEDFPKCIFALITKLNASDPWSRWTPVLGHPETDRLHGQFKFIYVLSPTEITEIKQKGGLTTGVWQLPIGAWTERSKGGEEELNIICSYIRNFFKTSSCHTQVFDVTLDQAYTDTTLVLRGIRIDEIQGPAEKFIDHPDGYKQFRREFTLIGRA